jgi:hypothetical protein
VPLCLLACARFEKKKKGEKPRGGHGSEKGVIGVIIKVENSQKNGE